MTEEEVQNAWTTLIHFLLVGDKLNAEIACKKWLEMQREMRREPHRE